MLLCLLSAAWAETLETVAVHEVLDNGLTIAVESMPQAAHAALWLEVDAGSADEVQGERGLAHLVEHAVAASMPGDALPVGLTLDAHTTWDSTSYELTFPATALEESLAVIAGRLGALPDRDLAALLAQERPAVHSERDFRWEDPSAGGGLLIHQALYGVGHPYHHPPIGSPVDVDAATPEDLVDFWARFYDPGHMRLALVTPGDAEEALAAVRATFVRLAPRERTDPPLATTGFRRTPAQVIEADLETPRAWMAWPVQVDTAADAAMAELLAAQVRLHWLPHDGGGVLVGHLPAQTSVVDPGRGIEDFVLAHLRENAGETAEATVVGLQRDLAEALAIPLRRAELLAGCLGTTSDPNCLPARAEVWATTRPAHLEAALGRWLREDRRSIVVVGSEAPEHLSAAPSRPWQEVFEAPAPEVERPEAPAWSTEAFVPWEAPDPRAAEPPPPLPIPPSLPSTTWRTLPSGAEVTHIPVYDATTTVVLLAYDRGSADLPPVPGWSPAWVGGPTLGGSSSRTAAERNEALERLGASLTSWVEPQATVLRLEVPDEALDAALALTGDLLRRPRYPEWTERRAAAAAPRLEDIDQVARWGATWAWWAADSLPGLRPDPDEWWRLGTDYLAQRHEALVQGAGLTITVASSRSTAELLSSLDLAVGDLGAAPSVRPPTTPEPHPEPRLGVDWPGEDLARLRVRIAAPGPSGEEPLEGLLAGHAARIALQARLTTRIRGELGLAYAVTVTLGREGATSWLEVDTRIEAEHVQATLGAIDAELKRLLEIGLAPQEVQRAQGWMLGMAQEANARPSAALAWYRTLEALGLDPTEVPTNLTVFDAEDLDPLIAAAFGTGTADSVVVVADRERISPGLADLGLAWVTAEELRHAGVR